MSPGACETGTRCLSEIMAPFDDITELAIAALVADRFRDKAERIAESLKLALFFRPGASRARAS